LIMNDVAFIVATLILFFINGLPFQRWSSLRAREQLLAAPVIGSCVLSVSTTILYVFGFSPTIAVVLVSVASATLVAFRLSLGWTGAVFNNVRFRSVDFVTTACFAVVLSAVVLPHIVGRENFAVFQANPFDTFNYLSMAVGYATHSYNELPNPNLSDNATLLQAAAALFARPTVSILYAGIYRILGTDFLSHAYDFLGALQINLFFSFLYLTRSLFSTRSTATTVASGSFAIGFFGQHLFDINSWSELLAVPMAIVLLVEFTRLLTLVGTRAGQSSATRLSARRVWKTELPTALGSTTIVAAGLIYSYPEIAPISFIACCSALLSAVIAYVRLGRSVSLRNLAICCALTGSCTLLLLIPYWHGTMQFLLDQISVVRSGATIDWHVWWQAYFAGRDQNNFVEISNAQGGWPKLFTLLSLPSDFLSAFMGLYLLQPTASWPLWLRAIYKLFILLWCIVVPLGIAWCVTSMFRTRRGLLGAERLQFRYIILAVVCAFAIPAYLLMSQQYWAAGKAITMLSPFVFFALVIPALAPTQLGSISALSWGIIGAQILFGAYRPYQVWQNGNGIHYKTPYPTFMGPIKTGVDWDIAKYHDTLAQCNLVKVDIENQILERAVESYLIDQSIPWFTLRRQDTYYGVGKNIGVVGNPNGWHQGCLVTDVLKAVDVNSTVIDLQRSKISCSPMHPLGSSGVEPPKVATMEAATVSTWHFAFKDKSIRCFEYHGGALAAGWALPAEDWGAWTDAPTARLLVPVSSNIFPNGAVVELEFGSFIVGNRQQRLDIAVNRKIVASTIFDASRPTQKLNFVLESADLDASRPITLELSMPDAVSPSELGVSSDSRKLAVGLMAVGIVAK